MALHIKRKQTHGGGGRRGEGALGLLMMGIDYLPDPNIFPGNRKYCRKCSTSRAKVGEGECRLLSNLKLGSWDSTLKSDPSHVALPFSVCLGKETIFQVLKFSL